MAQSRLRPVAAVVVALSVSMPTACTGDDGSNDPITIPTSSAPSSNASRSPTSTHEALVPLPDHVKVIADWTPTGEPRVDAAVLAAINVNRATWAVMAAGDLDAVPFENYVTGEAKRSIFEEFAGQFVKKGIGVTGTDRLFGFKVSNVSETGAQVVYCDDQYDLLPTDQKTGRVVPNTPDPAGGLRVIETVTLVEGRWKVATSQSEESVPQCRREH